MPVKIHPGLAIWNGADYAAGFRARMATIPASDAAPHSWQCGWEDADTDLRESARHDRVVTTGRTDDYGESWFTLFDAGGDARVHGIEFDESRTDPWKEGWINADVNLGSSLA
jgi:hypothetical protein